MADVALSKHYAEEQPCVSACNPWRRKRAKVSPSPGPAAGNGNADERKLAEEMNKLSFEEREKVFDDIHGVAAVKEETPEFVAKCIAELDAAIDAIPLKHPNKRAYNRALFLWPNLKTDKAFKLMFLRADEFDAPRAASRMMKYHEQKRILFGDDKLVKKIGMNDLLPEELEVFESGFLLTLPTTDQSKRPVFFSNVSRANFDKYSVDSVLRAFWYQMMAQVEDETAQKKGTILVGQFSSTLLGNPEIMKHIAKLALRTGYWTSFCLPLRYTSMHICYDDPRLEFSTNIIRMAVGMHSRLRLRPHLGSDVENEYTLMTFGIPSEGLLQKARSGDTAMHKDYVRLGLAAGREEDAHALQEGTKAGFVTHPTANDVLIGRGRPYRDFPGNAPWNELIHNNVDRYRECPSRFEKTRVSVEVVALARKSSQVRFLLERAEGGWKVLNDASARGKAAAALQNRIKVLARMEAPTGGTSTMMASAHPMKLQDWGSLEFETTTLGSFDNYGNINYNLAPIQHIPEMPVQQSLW